MRHLATRKARFLVSSHVKLKLQKVQKQPRQFFAAAGRKAPTAMAGQRQNSEDFEAPEVQAAMYIVTGQAPAEELD